jgi:hypothetical protein
VFSTKNARNRLKTTNFRQEMPSSFCRLHQSIENHQSKVLAPVYYRIARWINGIVIAGAVREPPLRPKLPDFRQKVMVIQNKNPKYQKFFYPFPYKHLAKFFQ